MDARVRVLVADDEASVRRGLRMQLQTEADIEVVGEAWDRDSAVALTATLLPDVVVLDVRMPRGIEGIEAAEILRERYPGTQVVVLSMHDDARTRAQSVEAGAASFVAKSEPCERLVDAILLAAGRGGRE
ncbi:MAG: response regulator transcription factor [Dehalococcoidia bacterium]